MILYTWAHSLVSFRVRIALNLKGLEPEYRYVNLLRDGGEQLTAAYSAVNPMQAVPTLVDGDRTLAQSVAILEYLEETHPHPPLYPGDPFARAQVRQVCEIVNSDIHPLGTPRVGKHLRALGVPKEQVQAWYPHWMREGLMRLESVLAPMAGQCCFGDAPTAADCFVVPQMYYAHRMGVHLEDCPTLEGIWEHMSVHPAVVKAMPAAQVDAEA